MSEVHDVRCRPAAAEDFTFLATMLGEAAVWRPDKPTPTGDQVLADPRYAMYLAGWPRHGDYGLVAEQDGPVGAAWYRTYTEVSHGHGFFSEEVPELSIAVVASRRHEGIGRRLLVDLIEASIAQRHPALSLSVNVDNPARGLYESVGFVPVEKHGPLGRWSDTPPGRTEPLPVVRRRPPLVSVEGGLTPGWRTGVACPTCPLSVQPPYGWLSGQ